jgi:hypothetical protein
MGIGNTGSKNQQFSKEECKRECERTATNLRFTTMFPACIASIKRTCYHGNEYILALWLCKLLFISLWQWAIKYDHIGQTITQHLAGMNVQMNVQMNACMCFHRSGLLLLVDLNVS